MILNRVEDSRDRLDRALADELYFFAQRRGIDFPRDWPRDLMLDKLRSTGNTDIDVPERPLGVPPDWHGERRPITNVAAGKKSMTAMELRKLEYEILTKNPLPGREIKQEVVEMTRAEMAKECKRRGIKMQRTDSKEKLRERLSGHQNAA